MTKKNKGSEEEEETEEQPQMPNPLELMMMAQQQGQLEERGIIYISGHITQELVSKVQAKLIQIHFNESFEGTVQLLISSPGGHVDAGWSLIDVMDWVRMPIRTVALGEIASMATMIFIAGDERVMGPNSGAMIHHFRGSFEGTYPELISDRKAVDTQYKKFIDHFIRCSKYKNETQIRKHILTHGNNWLTPKEMLQHGLCDKVSKRRNKKP